MSPFALHHHTLPAFAAGWPAELAAIVEAQLAQQIPAEALRTIVLAPFHDGTRLGVWLGTEWENYPYGESEENAAGFLSLGSWLDEVDRVSTGELSLPAPRGWEPRARLRLADPEKNDALRAAWRQLHDALVASAIELGTRHFATRFKQPVGVFISLTGAEARCVAFCHPHGAPLWPVQEHRKEHGYGSCYPTAAFGAQGLTVFYPEGEGSDSGAPTIRTWTAEQFQRVEESDRDLHVRFVGEAFDVRFSGGHTHEDFGGPSRQEVTEGLAAYFEGLGLLGKGAPTATEPSTIEALQRALTPIAAEDERRKMLVRFAQAHGVAALAPVLPTLGFSPKGLGLTRRALASVALEARQWAQALEQLEQISGEDRWHTLEVPALVGLGRWADVLRVAPEDDARDRALALGKLGRTAEGLALLGGKDDEDAQVVRALIGAPDGAALVRSALPRSVRRYLLALLEADATFAPLIAQHDALKAAVGASQALASALPVEALELGDAPLLAPRAERLFAAPPSEEEAAGLSLRVALARPGGFWGVTREGALLELSDGAPPRTLSNLGKGVTGLAASPAGLLVMSEGELRALDQTGAPRATVALPWRGAGPVASEGTLVACATGSVIHLATLPSLEVTGWVSAPGELNVSALGFVSPTLLAASAGSGLLLFEVSNPAKPVLVRRVGEDGSLLNASSGQLVLHVGDELVLARVEGTSVRVTARVPSGHTPRVVQGRAGELALAARGTVTLVREGVASQVQTFGPDAFALEPIALTMLDAGALALTSTGLVKLTERSLGVPELQAEVEAELPKVRAWLEERLAAWLAAGPVGGFELRWLRPESVWAYALPPCSVTAIPMLQPEELSLREPSDAERAQPQGQVEGRLEQAVEYQRAQLAVARRVAAGRVLLGELGAAWATRSTARQFVLCLETEQGPEVQVWPGGGEVAPARALSSQAKEKTLEEQLAASGWYRNLDAWVARAKKDLPFRAEVLEIFTRGQLTGARKLVLELLDVDRDGAAEAILSKAEQHFAFAFPALVELARRGHAEARARLTAVAEDLEGGLRALVARQVLGRLDEDATVTVLRAVLADLDGLDDALIQVLDALPEARLAQVKDALLAAKEDLGADGPFLVPLARAGWEPDEKTLKQGHQARARDDDFMSGLFDGDEQEPAAAVARVWIARRIASQETGPCWPAGVALEKARVGWQRLFDAGWRSWLAAGVVDRLCARLPTTARLGEDEARFALQFLYQLLLRGDERALTLGPALEAAQLDPKAQADVYRLARLARLQFGWSLVKAGRLAEARQVAEAAVREAPKDGQAAFFDARVAWLEANDASVAIPRIDAALTRAEDVAGRGRLLNLRGAALDALGQVRESIEWFQRALTANDEALQGPSGYEDATISQAALANLAEAHWKLGEKGIAKGFAEQAGRRGSKAAILGEILEA